MRTCGSCAHWGVGSTPRDQKEDTVFRPCGAVVHDHGWLAKPEYDGDKDFLGDEYSPEVKAEIAAVRKHLAVVQDGSGFYAALKVREDFGCVLWQEKKEGQS